MNAFLLAFLMNVNNLQPVVVTNCTKIALSDSKLEALKQVDKLKQMQMVCEKQPDSVSYACASSDKQRIGKIVVMKDETECKNFPQKMSSDLKALMNR